MRNNKKSFDEIIDDILILIVIIGFATFGIGCVIDSIFICKHIHIAYGSTSSWHSCNIFIVIVNYKGDEIFC